MDNETSFECIQVEISKLELQPNDVLVVKINRQVNTDEVKMIASALKAALPKGTRSIIMPSEYSIEVVRQY
jgi:hypothetical protein